MRNADRQRNVSMHDDFVLSHIAGAALSRIFSFLSEQFSPQHHIIHRGEYILFKEILIAVTVSIDTYLAASACCCKKIRIPVLSSVVINLICAAVLYISISFSSVLTDFVSADFCRISGGFVLITLGILTILKSFARSVAKRISQNGDISMKLGSTPLAVRLYLDDTAADRDNSKVLTFFEAVTLAVISSFDSAAIGLNSGFHNISPLYASLFTFLCGFVAVWLGSVTGQKISSLKHDFSWVGGVLLIIFPFVL